MENILESEFSQEYTLYVIYMDLKVCLERFKMFFQNKNN